MNTKIETKNTNDKNLIGLTTIRIVNNYSVWEDIDVELPEGKTPDDIKDVWFKWGNGSIEFKDGTFMNEIEEGEPSHEYFKRPITTRIFNEDSNEIWKSIKNE
tara:strand:- start:27 stop:335 length:309 start_codon:yes stop_codon:yes gene_type:complete